MYTTKWDLSELCPNENEFSIEYSLLAFRINDINEDCFTNGKKLYAFLYTDDEILMYLEKLYTYVSLAYDLDTSNNKALMFRERVDELFQAYTRQVAFFEPKFLSLDKKTIDKFYEQCPKLSKYKLFLDRIYRYKEHTLEEKYERLLSRFSSVFDRNGKTYHILTDSDLTFGKISDDNGKKVELTDSNYQLFLQSSNQLVRKNAFLTLHKTYAKFGNTIASLYYSHINELKVISELKNFHTILDMVVFDDELDSSVYKNLVGVVNKRMDVIYNYFKIKKDYLKLSDFHVYDTYAPLAKTNSFKYSYEEAVKIVLEALKPLGKRYLNVLEDGYKNGWVDVYPSRAKRSGAYSSGSYLTKPYMLLNFEGTYTDVSTLAHESGHSMHTYYSNKNNSYRYASYRIFVAEVASTVNELLFANYMLEYTDKKEDKIYILDKLMNLYKSTIYRQTMFAEFEETAYDLAEKDVPLTNELLSDKYYELNKKYFGKDVKLDKELRYEWLRIPHFYYRFYVYKYATGLSCATYIVKNINNKEFRNKYLEMLKVGDTKNPFDTLMIAGIDITDPSVIDSAIDYFEEIQEEFKKLISSK